MTERVDLKALKERANAYPIELYEYELAALVAVVDAALTIDAAFKRAGTQGVTMDLGPLLETLQPFMVTE